MFVFCRKTLHPTGETRRDGAVPDAEACRPSCRRRGRTHSSKQKDDGVHDERSQRQRSSSRIAGRRQAPTTQYAALVRPSPASTQTDPAVAAKMDCNIVWFPAGHVRALRARQKRHNSTPFAVRSCRATGACSCVIVGRQINDSIHKATRDDGCSTQWMHSLITRIASIRIHVRNGSTLTRAHAHAFRLHGELSNAPLHGEIGPVLATQRCGWYMLCRWAVACRRRVQLWKSMHV